MCTVCFFRKLKRQIKLNTKRKKTSEVFCFLKSSICLKRLTYDYLALFINLHAMPRKSYK